MAQHDLHALGNGLCDLCLACTLLPALDCAPTRGALMGGCPLQALRARRERGETLLTGAQRQPRFHL